MEHKAAVAVFYLPDNLSPERQSLWELLDGGAMHLEARYYEAGADDVPFQGPTWTDREIDVRGTKGQLAELRKNSHGAGKNWRMIRWAEPSKIGGTVRWIAGTHPDLYSFEEALAFVDALILAS